MKKNIILQCTMLLICFSISSIAQTIDLRTVEDESSILDLNRSSDSEDAIIMFDLNAPIFSGTEDWILGVDGSKNQSLRLFKRESMLNEAPNPPTITDTEIFEATTAGNISFQSDHVLMGTSGFFGTKLLVRPNASNDYTFIGYGFDGVAKLVLDPQGQVGINELLPQYDLHIKLTGDAADENGGIALEELGSSDVWTTYVTGAHNYALGYNGTNKVFILDTDGSYHANSDRRLKSDIEPLEDILQNVLRLKPSKYYYKESKDRAKVKSYGFIAQEVEEVFPDLVSENEGYKGIAYDNFAVLSVAAIQELYQKIEQQQQQHNDLQQQNQELIQRIERLEKLWNDQQTHPVSPSQIPNPEIKLPINNNAPYLNQNRPNPFGKQTLIDMFIPTSTQSAFLQISTLDGKVLKNIKIDQREQHTQQVNTENWASGTYTYSLIVDGHLVATQKMIIK